MLPEAILVDICIATCRRPLLLKDLLQSLAAQRLIVPVELRVIVVDNDQAGSARETVAWFAGLSPWPVVYDVEPERNISLARNRSLRYATGEYVAFIDDDETADPDWLAELLRVARFYHADVVCGPVLAVVPADAPAWAADGRLYQRPRFRSGAVLKTGGCGNMLVRRSTIRRYPVPFDPDYGRSGGEDHDLCQRIIRDRGKLLWCDSALVREHLGSERMTLRYLVRRSLNGGRVFARREMPGRSFLRKVCWFMYRSVLVASISVVMVFVWPVSRYRGIFLLMKVCSNLGQLSILTSREDDFYAAN